MTPIPSDSQLERYLGGSLSGPARAGVERALCGSPEARDRLARILAEQEIIEAIKDSRQIRLPDEEEQRIEARLRQRVGSMRKPQERPPA